MYCPKCGTPYEEDETICSNCSLPLSNATFVEVKKKRRWPWILLVILLLLSIGGVFGYQYYLHYVEKECRKVTNEIFSYAHDFDFSAVDPEYLPEELKDNPNVRAFVKEKLQDTIEESNLLSIVNMAGITIDSDQILDDIISGATYTIEDVSTDYHSCMVTVKTSNTDYSSLPDMIYQQLISEMKEEGSNIWQSIRKKLAELFFGASEKKDELDNQENHEKEEVIDSQEEHWKEEALDNLKDYEKEEGLDSQEEQEKLKEEKASSDKAGTNTSLLSELYQKAKAKCPKLETTGTILYGIQDGQWTLISLDEELFYTYYGLTEEVLQNLTQHKNQ